MSKAIDDVLAERRRQIDIEGWSAEHDDEHTDRSLAIAASDYAMHYVGFSWLFDGSELGARQYRSKQPIDWPWAWDEAWWKPKDPRRDLVRAAALLIAEIERFDRAEQNKA